MINTRVRFLYSVFTPSGGAPSGAPGETNTVTNPTIFNLDLPIVNTEDSYILPAGTKQFLVQVRNSNAKLQLAYISGDSSLNFLTIKPNNWYSMDGLDATASVTLYIQSNLANTVVEITSWA